MLKYENTELCRRLELAEKVGGEFAPDIHKANISLYHSYYRNLKMQELLSVARCPTPGCIGDCDWCEQRNRVLR